MAEVGAVAAVDWGGTWFRVALVNRAGEILWQQRETNPVGGSLEEYLDLARRLLSAAFRQAGAVPAIGLAVAGPVEPESGILYQPPNLGVLDGLSLKAQWRQEFGVPVAVGNDANLAALGEHRYGAGRDAAGRGHPVKALFYITISTGVGGGAVERGALFLGANGLGVEIGHTTVDNSPAASVCQCGNRGCLEAVASGTGIANAARAMLAAPASRRSALAALDRTTLTSKDVVEAALAGDALASGVLESAIQGLGIGLTNALHLFNPDLIVLGGGVTNGLLSLNALPRIQQHIQERAMSQLHRQFELVPSTLGDAAGLLGAAAAAWQQPETAG